MTESSKKNSGKFTKKNASKMGRRGAEARWGKTYEESDATGSAAERPLPGSVEGGRNATTLQKMPDDGLVKAPGNAASLALEVSVPELTTVPAPCPAPIQKPKWLVPRLCPSCRQLGYAHCRNCMLATDSSLALDGDVIFGVRRPTAQDLWPWHRCKRCDNCFKAPQYPVPRFCPDCVAEDARQPAQHASSGEP